MADRVPASPALPSPARYSNAAPFDHLAREVPVRADNEDEKYWYLNKATFEQICGDYDPGETALALRDRKLLRYDDKSLTVRPPRSLSGLQLKVYAVSKRLAQGGRDHG